MQLCETHAQGRYHYSCDGREMPVQDSWQLGQDENGQRLLVSQRLVGEQNYGLEVRAFLSAGLVTECRVQWRDQVGEVNAHYQLQSQPGAEAKLGAPLEAQWEGPNGPQQTQLEGRERLLFPLMRIFMGPLLLKLCQFEQGCEIVSPDIIDPSQRGKLLSPHISHRHARLMVGDINIQGLQHSGDVSGYIYQGDEAERDAHCYVDARGLLVGYDWPSSTGRLWQVRLRDLEWSPQLAGLL